MSLALHRTAAADVVECVEESVHVAVRLHLLAARPLPGLVSGGSGDTALVGPPDREAQLAERTVRYTEQVLVEMLHSVRSASVLELPPSGAVRPATHAVLLRGALAQVGGDAADARAVLPQLASTRFSFARPAARQRWVAGPAGATLAVCPPPG